MKSTQNVNRFHLYKSFGASEITYTANCVSNGANTAGINTKFYIYLTLTTSNYCARRLPKNSQEKRQN